ncbi:CLUMA_CG005444, isoform A [Clunio marinus]|uniref:CLUMA_CG005444, isoform A n=1 Tax=Clunio marinus TaxID=568069 RepID=A0A1J1HUZ2_9DIPT|nr:CLUMA_CG005444, isoform A [Clunio marinus]
MTFSQPNCRTQKLKAINYFSETELKWSSSQFFLDKIDNFQGCEIIFSGYISPPAAYEELQDNKTIKITGYHVDLINIIAPYANYTVKISFFMKRQRKTKLDVFISPLLLHDVQKRHHFNMPTQAIHYESVRAIVPPRESYTSFEKLLLAFDKPVWNLIIITFALAFMAIIILRFCPRSIREFVIGRNVKEPALNVLIAFFGVGQTILPRRNFARFLLIMFILYSLIIRTAYQGKSFEFLQKYMKRKGVQTVKDLFDKNYTIYTNKFLQTEWKTADIVKQMLNQNNITTPIHMLDEIIAVGPKSIKFVANMELFKTFDGKLTQLREAGIMDHIIKPYYKLHKEKPNNDPKVLTMDDLSAGFVDESL